MVTEVIVRITATCLVSGALAHATGRLKRIPVATRTYFVRAGGFLLRAGAAGVLVFGLVTAVRAMR